jgi:4-amino-4-deoxy-L-arabinose transferase-like glycosyltransferase
MSGDGSPGISARGAILILIALSIPLFFFQLGAAALLDPDEPYYAVPALEMLKSHSWAVPVFRGEPWFDKPVFFYWCVLAGYKLFGVTEFATRIGSAIAALAGAFGLVLLSPSGWKFRNGHLWGAIVLVTTLEYAVIARAAVTDMTLTLFFTLGFLAVARYLESRRVAFAAAAGGAFGLAVLTKGPVGALVPAIALVGYGLWMRRRELLHPRALAAAATGFLATAAPWYVYMVVAHRDLVVKVFLGEENFGRFVNPEHRQIPFFYVAVFAAGMLPWSSALPVALWDAIGAAWSRDEGGGTSPGPAFALAWFAAVVGLFSLSASKLLTYVLPAFPPAAFLVARFWCDAMGPGVPSGRPARRTMGVAWSGGAIAVLVGAAAIATGRVPKFAHAFPALVALAVVLSAGALAGVVAVRAGRLRAFVAAQSAIAIVIVVGGVVYALPRVEPEESTRALVADLRSRGLDAQVAGAFRVPDVSLDFYLDRTLLREDDPKRLPGRLAADPSGLWIVRTQEIGAVAAGAGMTAEPVLTRGRRSVVRWKPAEGERSAR